MSLWNMRAETANTPPPPPPPPPPLPNGGGCEEDGKEEEEEEELRRWLRSFALGGGFPVDRAASVAAHTEK